MFFCIKGKNHNGHFFIEEAITKGVSAFVIDEKIDMNRYPKAIFLNVKNTLRALQKLAQHHRSQFNHDVIAITGSNGKTIVKEWMNQLLASNFLISRSPKSFNSQLGVPLSILEIETFHNLAIIEAGISEKNEMTQLASIVQPTIGVFTLLGEAHQQNFASLKEKLDEKLKLFEACHTLIFPSDNELVYDTIHSQFPNKKLISFGKKIGAVFQIIEQVSTESNTSVHAIFNGKKIEIQIPFSDQASVHNALCAYVTAATILDNSAALSSKLQFLNPVNMRMQLIAGAENTLLINDAYSSDLTSLDIALDFMEKHAEGRKKTLIVSDMEQAGYPEEVLYKKIIDFAANHGVSKIIGIGSKISTFQTSFPLESKFYTSTQEAIQNIKPNDHSGEIILIKGARKFEFEKIISALEDKTHETVLEVNLDALAQNFHHYKNKLSPHVKMMVMVKASGYGAGAVEVARVLEFCKADYLGVAYVDEGISLRQSGVSLPIMVMNSELNALDRMIEFNLEPEIYSERSLVAFADALKKTNRKESYPIHIKLDTGMKRLGFEPHQVANLIELLSEHSNFHVKSIFTHLAATDNPNHDAFTNSQLDAFEEMAFQIENAIGYPVIKHAANTSGIERFERAQYNMVRLGIGIYGISNDSAEQPNLHTVGVLKTTISQIKTLKVGESVGYNRNFIAKEEMQIATIPLGYADGLRRNLSNGNWSIKVNHTLCPIVGNVCMDMTMIDISKARVSEGDEAIIFDDADSLYRFAQACHTIPYEILTSIPSRVKRVYIGEV
ncbi:MAG: bifunctional UDP-N-acetylmuramoyl-tripeptide:D-alanyl-D-alanine ligase/alanine racemase [Flavobacteriales bacterium]